MRRRQPLMPNRARIWRSRPVRRSLTSIALVLITVILSACDPATNRELVATATPYPIRSPVAASPAAATPRPGAVFVATGTAALATDDFPAAATAFAAAVATAPSDAASLVGSAATLAALGDLAAAETAFTAAIAADPGLAAAYSGRALVIAEAAVGDIARYQAAMDDLNRALAIDPALVEARLGQARVLIARAEYRGDPADLTRALAHLDSLPDLATNQTQLLLRARLLALTGDDVGARAALGRIFTLGEPPADVLATRGAVALAADAWDDAITHATAAITRTPYQADAHRTLIQAHLARQDPAAALTAADALLAIRPDDGRGHYLRGVALTALGRGNEARKGLESARPILATSPVYTARIDQALRDLPG